LAFATVNTAGSGYYYSFPLNKRPFGWGDAALGLEDGIVLGALLGASEGTVLGASEGTLLGASEGASDSAILISSGAGSSVTVDSPKLEHRQLSRLMNKIKKDNKNVR